MADGNLMIRSGSVFFLGPGGSGKSHTVAILLDEEPPSKRESTPCAKSPIRTIAQCKVGISGVRFVRIKDDEYCDMLSMTTKRFECIHITQAQPGQQEEVIELTTGPSQVTLSVVTPDSATKQGDSVFHPMKSKPKAHFQGSGLEIELLRRMQATPKSSEDLNDKELMDMRDSGGQPSFHEVLPLFVKNTNFGVLTVKLNESLDAYPLVEYYSNGNPIGKPFHSPFTHLQTFSHCMRVLQSTCDRKSCPKLVFVGTHKDLEHECKPKESRRTKNEKLQKIIPPAMKDSVIYCDSSLQELLFAINVKNPEDEDRETAGYVRQLMIEELRKTPKQKVPVQYFALENAFKRLAKYKRKGVLSKEECFQEATAFHFTRESFEDALRYLHSLKLIFYYEEVLPDVVFIDAQTLLDKITELVEYSLCAQSRVITATGALEEFKAYGIITLDLLSKFSTHYVPNVFTAKELVLLLKHLRVLAEVGEGKYLVPCLLKVVNIPRPSPHLAVPSISALLFYFGPDGPKLGVYCCLIASLITEAKWKLVTENDRPIKVSRNQVRFRLPGGDPGSITITDAFSTFFHVSIDFAEDVSDAKAHQICCNVGPSLRETILAEIRKASQKLNYDNSIPTVAFPCISSKHQTTDVHPATVSSSGLLTCTTHPTSVCSELNKQHQVWLGNLNTGTGDHDHSESGHVTTEVCTRSVSPTTATVTLARLSYWKTPKGKIRIIKRIAPYWNKLGVLLDFDPSGTQLTIIDKKYPRDPEACCQAMFQYWLEGNGVKPCSWHTLIELLEVCDQQALAEEIQEALTNT